MSFCVIHNGGSNGKNHISINEKKTGEVFFSKDVKLEDTLPLRRRKRKIFSNFGLIDSKEADLPIDSLVEINDDLKKAYEEFELNLNCINGVNHKILFFEDYKTPINWDSSKFEDSNFLIITHLTYDKKTKTLKEKLLMEVSLEKTGSKLFDQKAVNRIYEEGNEDQIDIYFENQWKEGVKNRFKDLECNISNEQAQMIFPFLMQRLFELAPNVIDTKYISKGRLIFDEKKGKIEHKKVKCKELAGRQRANISYHPYIYNQILELDAISRKKRHIQRRENIQEDYVNAILQELSYVDYLIKEKGQDNLDYIVQDCFIKHKKIFFNLNTNKETNLPTESARAKFAYTIYLLKQSKECGKQTTALILDKVFEFLKTQYKDQRKAEKVISMLKQDIIRVSKKGFFEFDEINMPNMPRINLLLNPSNQAVYSEKNIFIKILTKDGKTHFFKEFAEGKIKLEDISEVLYMKGKTIVYSSKELPSIAFDVISDILPYNEMKTKVRKLFKYYIDIGNRLNVLECWSDERELEFEGEIYTGHEIYNLIRRTYGEANEVQYTQAVKKILEDIIEEEYKKGPFTEERKREIERKYSYKYIGPDLKRARHMTGYAAETFILAGIKEVIKHKFPDYSIIDYFPKNIEFLYNKKTVSTNGNGSSKRVNDELHPDFKVVLKKEDEIREILIESKCRRKLNSGDKLNEKILDQYKGIKPEDVLIILSTWQGIERPELDNSETFKEIEMMFNTCFTKEFYNILKRVNIQIDGEDINLGEEYRKFINAPTNYILTETNFKLIKNRFSMRQLLPGFE
ncbi:MAG: hypothetical protein WC356_00305 [Candidatus Micrarchaeia archaeon]|jgi:hypothetical protein